MALRPPLSKGLPLSSLLVSISIIGCAFAAPQAISGNSRFFFRGLQARQPRSARFDLGPPVSALFDRQHACECRNGCSIPAVMRGMARFLQLQPAETNISFSFLKVLWLLPARGAPIPSERPAGEIRRRGFFLYQPHPQGLYPTPQRTHPRTPLNPQDLPLAVWVVCVTRRVALSTARLRAALQCHISPADNRAQTCYRTRLSAADVVHPMGVRLVNRGATSYNGNKLGHCPIRSPRL
jgi:hypothetical protein